MRTRGARIPDYKMHLNMRMQTRTRMVEQQEQDRKMPPFCMPTRRSKSGPVKMKV